MSKVGLLQCFDTKPGRIVFPFCAHFFHILNAKQSISDNFSLTYLSKDEISRETHKLAYSTNLHKDEIAQTDFLIEQERYITCTRKAIIDYSSGLLLTKTKVLSILADIPDVESIRYIVLSQKKCNQKINDIYDQYTVTLRHSVPLIPNFISNYIF